MNKRLTWFKAAVCALAMLGAAACENTDKVVHPEPCVEPTDTGGFLPADTTQPS